MLKLIEKAMDKLLLPNKHFQDYINNRYNSNECVRIYALKGASYKYMGFEYVINDQLETIHQVISEYKLSDIRKSDIVLDIGANIGAFTMIASKKAKHVFAIEPVYTDDLIFNLSINGIKNVTVLEMGLGKKSKQCIKYGNRSKIVDLYSLTEIIDMCGEDIDFLKCDCEGGEWCITPEEIQGIRRIEVETHFFKDMPQCTEFERVLKEARFDYEIDTIRRETVIIHAHASIASV